jgi:uncharacterized membrane protein
MKLRAVLQVTRVARTLAATSSLLGVKGTSLQRLLGAAWCAGTAAGPANTVHVARSAIVAVRAATARERRSAARGRDMRGSL